MQADAALLRLQVVVEANLHLVNARQFGNLRAGEDSSGRRQIEIQGMKSLGTVVTTGRIVIAPDGIVTIEIKEMTDKDPTVVERVANMKGEISRTGDATGIVKGEGTNRRQQTTLQHPTLPPPKHLNPQRPIPKQLPLLSSSQSMTGSVPKLAFLAFRLIQLVSIFPLLQN